MIPASVNKIGDYSLAYYSYAAYETRKNTDFIMYGKRGTAAETYANKENLVFIDLDDITAESIQPDMAGLGTRKELLRDLGI